MDDNNVASPFFCLSLCLDQVITWMEEMLDVGLEAIVGDGCGPLGCGETKRGYVQAKG